MGEQLNIFDFIMKPDKEFDLSQYINVPEPMCYSCGYQIRRGPFRLCSLGRDGYRRIGQDVDCDRYKEME